MSETLHQVTQQIEAAFAETEYPGDERIAVFARVGRTLADVLRGKHWSEVTLEDLYKHRWEIFLLTPDTFHYYIPIFMLAALYHYEEMDSLAHNVIFSLSPQREEHISNYFNGQYNDYFSRRAAVFNRQEKLAILAFLEGFNQLHPGEKLIYDIQLIGVTIPFWARAVDVPTHT